MFDVRVSGNAVLSCADVFGGAVTPLHGLRSRTVNFNQHRIVNVIVERTGFGRAVAGAGPAGGSRYRCHHRGCHGTELPDFRGMSRLASLVTFFGGTLGTLPTPVHGKPSEVCVEKHPLFADMPKRFNTGRYHSLFAEREILPKALRVIADTDGGLIMGIAHASLAIAAVQFHPESIMSLEDGAGRRLIQNAVSLDI